MQKNNVMVKEKELNIYFNQKVWSLDGTNYEGCFQLTKDLYNDYRDKIGIYLQKFRGETVFSQKEKHLIESLRHFRVERNRRSGKAFVYLTIEQTHFLKKYLEKNNVTFNQELANQQVNYYIEF